MRSEIDIEIEHEQLCNHLHALVERIQAQVEDDAFQLGELGERRDYDAYRHVLAIGEQIQIDIQHAMKVIGRLSAMEWVLELDERPSKLKKELIQ